MGYFPYFNYYVAGVLVYDADDYLSQHGTRRTLIVIPAQAGIH
jgi:hypothetical protein